MPTYNRYTIFQTITKKHIQWAFLSCLRVSVANLSTPTASLEKIGIKIVSSVLTVVEIYRPPPAPTIAFFDDFRALLSEIQAQPGMQFICGDFNCPGNSCDTIDERLSDAIDDFNMSTCSDGATRITHDGSPGNLLDIIIHNANTSLVNGFEAVDTGIADHKLIMISVNFHQSRVGATSFKGRNLKKLDYNLLLNELSECLFVRNPSSDIDTFVDQMENDVTSVLDRLAPVHTTRKRIGKNSASELSSEAVEAKRIRRRCEKQFKKISCLGTRRAGVRFFVSAAAGRRSSALSTLNYCVVLPRWCCAVPG